MLRSLAPPDSASPQAVVTLGQVRQGPRAQNDYVDSLRPHPPPALKNVPLSTGLGGPGLLHPQSQGPSQRAGVAALPPRIVRPTLNSSVISSQPTSVSPPLKKEPIDADGADVHTESIICSKCGKCRCGACTEPRDLPSRWLCGDKCEVSLDRLVDVCSCFCCVKTVFYHCGSQDEETDLACYEDPCACCGSTAPHCVKRWTCIALMSLFLPCLWCYCPARGCVMACTACYNKCRKKGCECSRRVDRKPGSKHSQTRRLLVDSDSSSA